jgi:hypothetical protein
MTAAYLCASCARREPVQAGSTKGADVPTVAVALLQVPGKAKPSDLVLYVLHNGLSVATAHKPPAWQHHFRYVAAETMEANVPWWKVMGISNLDDLENPRKRKQ